MTEGPPKLPSPESRADLIRGLNSAIQKCWQMPMRPGKKYLNFAETATYRRLARGFAIDSTEKNPLKRLYVWEDYATGDHLPGFDLRRGVLVVDKEPSGITQEHFYAITSSIKGWQITQANRDVMERQALRLEPVETIPDEKIRGLADLISGFKPEDEIFIKPNE